MLTDRDEMSYLHRGHSIDASYQISVHLAKRFQRKIFKCEKLTDDGRQVIAKAHMAFRQDELKMSFSNVRNNKVVCFGSVSNYLYPIKAAFKRTLVPLFVYIISFSKL